MRGCSVQIQDIGVLFQMLQRSIRNFGLSAFWLMHRFRKQTASPPARKTPCQLPPDVLSHSPLIRNGGLQAGTPRLFLQALPGLKSLDGLPLISNRRLVEERHWPYVAACMPHHTTADTTPYCPRPSIPVEEGENQSPSKPDCC